MPDERDVRREQERHGLLDALGREPDGGSGRWAAAVEDEHVEAAERTDRRLHEALEVLRDREVALDGERTEALGLALEEIAAPPEHRDVGALGDELLGHREAHPRGGAADDRRATGEPEVHVGGRLLAGVFSGREAPVRDPRRLRGS